MLVFLEGLGVPINTSKIQVLGGGEDGTLYKLGGSALKILKSSFGYMTEEKIRDLRDSIPNSEDIRIVPPILIATKSGQFGNLKINPAFGYTERFINENPNFLFNSIDKLKLVISNIKHPKKYTVISHFPLFCF